MRSNPDAESPRAATRKLRSPAGPRERLVAEAGFLFARQGPDAVTIREIATAAKVQLSDIYRHFPDKHALYVEVCRTLFEDQASRAEAALLSETAAPQRLLAFTVTLYRDLLEDSRFIPILVRELLQRDAAGVAELANGAFHRQFELVVGCLRAIDYTDNAEPTAFSLFVLALGHIQMAPFGRAVPVRGFQWDDPAAMARFILHALVPTIAWPEINLTS